MLTIGNQKKKDWWKNKDEEESGVKSRQILQSVENLAWMKMLYGWRQNGKQIEQNFLDEELRVYIVK